MALQSSNNEEFTIGQQKPNSNIGEYNNLVFAVQQALSKMQTSTLVKIVSCTNEGGLSPVGFVDVQPLVDQIDGNGTPEPHVVIYNLPYFRIQGGGNAVIIDPEPGDIGICVFASRDISKVKATKKQAPPDTFRQYSFSDGMFLGGVLNGTPTQYTRYSATGIDMTSPIAIELNAPIITMNAPDVVVNASNKVRFNTPLIESTGDIVDNVVSNTNTIAEMRSIYNGHYHSDPQGGNVSTPIGSM